MKKALRPILRDNPYSAFGVAGGPSAPAVPFEYDADTYWWDFDYGGNTIDDMGDDTVSLVPERIAGYVNFTQTTKDFQPLKVLNGVNFLQDTNRRVEMDAYARASIANGKQGFYFAANINAETHTVNLLAIARNSGSNPSRGLIDITSSRLVRLRAANNDGATLASVATAPAITLGQWYTLEVYWECDPNTVNIWYNGVLQTLTTGPDGTYDDTFPASAPSAVNIGNHTTATTLDSFDGTFQSAILYNGLPSTTIRESISAYLNSVRPA